MAVSRSSPASSSASLTVRTAWPSFSPASQIGYQRRSATAATLGWPVVQEQQVEVAARRQLAAPVAADGDEGDASARRPPPRLEEPASQRVGLCGERPGRSAAAQGVVGEQRLPRRSASPVGSAIRRGYRPGRDAFSSASIASRAATWIGSHTRERRRVGQVEIDEVAGRSCRR